MEPYGKTTVFPVGKNMMWTKFLIAEKVFLIVQNAGK